MGSSEREWREALASWAIPDDILAKAPESPWSFPVELFASRAQAAPSSLTPSNRCALDALPEGGSVLDVGCGAGAASLALVPKAGALIGVDPSAEMLRAFTEKAGAAGVPATAIEGSWPEASPRAPGADVVVCHHVVYNVPGLGEFALRLTDHAGHRVVVEMTATHPLTNMNDLWMRFHGIRRPDRPTADDAMAVLREVGLDPKRKDWVSFGGGGFSRRGDLIAFVRRRLCLPPERDSEIGAAVADKIVEREGRFGFGDRPVVSLWWEGSAPRKLSAD